MSNITLDAVTKEFGDLTAVDDVSYTINDDEFFVIVGPSGCGKSTSLRLIAGFETPTSGSISLKGEPIGHLAPEDRDIRMVFQDYALFPHMSVGENIAFGLKMNDVDPDTHDSRVADVLELVGLPDIEESYPETLSGGQQQRIALARALVLEPDVLLLDEPLSNLDKNLRDRMQVELKRIQRETGVTAIHVTHNQEEALSLADQVCVMNDGVIEQIGPPEEVYYRPRNRFVADFLGDSNTFSATVLETGGGTTELGVADSSVRLVSDATPSDSGAQTVFFRPEHVQMAEQFPDGTNTFDATVASRLFTGDKIRYQLDIAGGTDADGLTLTAFSDSQWEAGQPVRVRASPEQVLLL
mgnify:CR=1 FL=1